MRRDPIASLLTKVASSGHDAETIPWFDGALDEDEPAAAASPAPPPAPPLPPASRRSAAAAAPQLRPGIALTDEGEIGRGGMGSIRRLYDPELRRRVAMKVLEPSAVDPNAAQRFVDEARITGLLDHPNIVPIHDLVIDHNGLTSYTMKLVEGQTLSQLIAEQRTRRDLERILGCLIRVCEALSFAHGRGVIHRDLKPDNIMVGSHGQVYVMDWGCALVVGEARALVNGHEDPDGIVIGTVEYMAPEQARGQIGQIDGRTDVFGVGALLYKVLTGTAPYTGQLMAALMRAQQGDVRPIDECTDGPIKPPPHLSQIAMKAMAADPADRFQSTEELAEALRSFLGSGNWFPLRVFPKGSVIVREGDAADAAYIITSGRCEVHKADPNDPNNPIVLRMMMPGEVFGETAIFANAPRSATVIALDEVSAVVVERAAIEKMTDSSWLGLFVKALADRFLELDERLAESR